MQIVDYEQSQEITTSQPPKFEKPPCPKGSLNPDSFQPLKVIDWQEKDKNTGQFVIKTIWLPNDVKTLQRLLHNPELINPQAIDRNGEMKQSYILSTILELIALHGIPPCLHPTLSTRPYLYATPNPPYPSHDGIFVADTNSNYDLQCQLLASNTIANVLQYGSDSIPKTIRISKKEHQRYIAYIIDINISKK